MLIVPMVGGQLRKRFLEVRELVELWTMISFACHFKICKFLVDLREVQSRLIYCITYVAIQRASALCRVARTVKVICINKSMSTYCPACTCSASC